MAQTPSDIAASESFFSRQRDVHRFQLSSDVVNLSNSEWSFTFLMSSRDRRARAANGAAQDLELNTEIAQAVLGADPSARDDVSVKDSGSISRRRPRKRRGVWER